MEINYTDVYEEVIGYNPAWIDEDFNPNGTRIGFLSDYGDDEVEGQTVAENPSAVPDTFVKLSGVITIMSIIPYMEKRMIMNLICLLTIC